MSYLVHCILRNGLAAVPATVERSVRLVASGNLAAAVTSFAPKEETSARLLAYESVVSALHASCAVIPLRYGCVMDREARIGEMLDERRAEYEALLDRLEDQVEIGLRVLWEAVPAAPDPSGRPGTTWLAGMRQRHSAASGLTGAEREWAGSLCAGLSDLYSGVNMEASEVKGSRVVSLYFLVARAVLLQFRGQLGRIVSGQGRRFLVSGPWPPYNFVGPAI